MLDNVPISLWHADLCDTPKLSISSAKYSRSSRLSLKTASRIASACCCVQA
jgi:hypothetical protein